MSIPPIKATSVVIIDVYKDPTRETRIYRVVDLSTISYRCGKLQRGIRRVPSIERKEATAIRKTLVRRCIREGRKAERREKRCRVIKVIDIRIEGEKKGRRGPTVERYRVPKGTGEEGAREEDGGK